MLGASARQEDAQRLDYCDDLLAAGWLAAVPVVMEIRIIH